MTIIGYAEDYAWFAGLVRRLFPDEAEEALSAPDARARVERFARLVGEKALPSVHAGDRVLGRRRR